MDLPRPHTYGLLAGIALACGLAFSAMLLSSTWNHISESQVVTVTGSARKIIRSDFVVWHASFSTDADSLLEAQRKLNSDLAKVEIFLRANGQKDYIVQPVQVREILANVEHERDAVPVRIGYRLSQSVVVRSDDVDATPRMASQSTELLEQGVVFVSEKIDFIYTKAGEAKVEMMADAAKDARTRAEQIAVQGGRTVKEMRSAKAGVVQVNPLFATDASWDGNNDTTSLEKNISVTVTATFSLR